MPKILIMPILFEHIPITVISTAVDKTRNRGETYQLIVAPVERQKNHWYANVYPTSYNNFDNVEELLAASPGDVVYISGNVRKYKLDNAFGVVLDVTQSWLIDDDEDTANDA